MKYTLLTLIFCFMLCCSCGGEKSAEELLTLAHQSYTAGHYYEARKYLAEAIKLKPNDKEIVIEISKTYAAENMFDSAFAHLSRADKLYPNDRRINQLLHEAGVKTEHWMAAIQALIILGQTGDSIEHYYRQIGEYALNDSAGHIAFYYFGKLIEMQPDSLGHYLKCAEGGILSGEPQNSLEVLKSAHKKFGDEPILLYELGRLYGLMRNLDEAEKTYRLLVSKDNSTLNQLQLATILARADKRAKKEEAYTLFKKLRLETPDFARVDSILRVLEKELAEPQ
jgi:tetratricopeptide (TPR) repeat protein